MESLIQSPGVQALIRHFREEGRKEAIKEGREEGREEGRTVEARSALLRVLTLRGLVVTDGIRRRVEAERDLARLEAWHGAAVTAAAVDDVFE